MSPTSGTLFLDCEAANISFVVVVDRSLISGGAQRLGFVGKADETLRSDRNWRMWKEDILTHLGDSLSREQLHSRQLKYEAEIELVDAAEKYGNPDCAHGTLQVAINAGPRPSLLRSHMRYPGIDERWYITWQLE